MRPYRNDDQESPWRKISTREVYSNPWMKVREDSVIRPDGNPGIYGVVETKIAVGVAALTPAREIYLVGQYRYTVSRYSWEIIEGGAEHGEDPLLAIQRELKEEAGLSAANWSELGPLVHLSNCITDEKALLYLATGLSEGIAQPEPVEVLQVARVPFRQAQDMVSSGEITDAMSIIAIHRIERMILEGAIR